MARHEFGIMDREPSSNESLDTYEPQKYNCIAVEDDFIEPIMMDLLRVDCYWHTLQRAKKGFCLLRYYSYTT